MKPSSFYVNIFLPYFRKKLLQLLQLLFLYWSLKYCCCLICWSHRYSYLMLAIIFTFSCYFYYCLGWWIFYNLLFFNSFFRGAVNFGSKSFSYFVGWKSTWWSCCGNIPILINRGVVGWIICVIVFLVNNTAIIHLCFLLNILLTRCHLLLTI